jgi:hypothetical protein
MDFRKIISFEIILAIYNNVDIVGASTTISTLV